MDKKKLLISGLTVAGFLAASYLPQTGMFAWGAESSAQQTKETQKGVDAKSAETQPSAKAKKGTCGTGTCSAMKDKSKGEPKSGTCSATKGAEKKGTCTAMK